MPGERPLRTNVSFEAIRRRGERSWLVTWRIANGGADPIGIVEAWHPHRRFHSSRLRRALRVPPGGSASLELPARVDGAPGDVIENSFLILRLARGRERWRILARFSLHIDDAGMPRPRIEAVDAHPAER